MARYIELGLEHCILCGCPFTDNIPLQKHHRDRNRNNDEPSNTLILCKPCHIRLHHPESEWHKQGVRRLREQGYTFQAIANILHISRQRAHQILKSSENTSI